jgi:hypothetical protein
MASAFITISKYSLTGKHLRGACRLSIRAAFVVILAVLLQSPGSVRGAGSITEESIHKAGIAPAGVIESLGVIRIDGRVARSGAVLLGNELIEAPAIESAQVTLNETGRITLSGGSSLKFVSVLREGDGVSTLFAYLMAGAMTISLNGRASARICANDSIFALSPGSSARLLVSEGHGRALSSKGEVKEDSDWRLFRAAPVAIQTGAQTTPGEYKIEPYNFTFGLGGYADIEARSVRYLQFRVTDKDDRPAPDLLLLILLKNKGDSPGDGSINYGATMMRVTTDHDGVATARFDAGVIIGANASLEVTIAKNNQTLNVNIRIVKPKGFWTLKNALSLMTTTAAASAVTAVAANSSSGEIPTVSPAPVEEEPVIPGEPESAIRRRRQPKEAAFPCPSCRPPIRATETPPEAPNDRCMRVDHSETPPSTGLGDRAMFSGASGRNWPRPQEPKSWRGGRRMFRGKFSITF